ncbi:MAG: hypothetical protein OEX08_01745 [Candidatus Nomurabacteria bacterium]|nr:hypothetical protein [Candidatus Nomurabacteria bacterium]
MSESKNKQYRLISFTLPDNLNSFGKIQHFTLPMVCSDDYLPIGRIRLLLPTLWRIFVCSGEPKTSDCHDFKTICVSSNNEISKLDYDSEIIGLVQERTQEALLFNFQTSPPDDFFLEDDEIELILKKLTYLLSNYDGYEKTYKEVAKIEKILLIPLQSHGVFH